MPQWAHTTKLYYTTVGGTEFTEVADLVDMEAKKLKRAVIDTTTVSQASLVKTSRSGMVTPDPFKFKIQYTAAAHETLLGIFMNASPNRDWKIELSGGETLIGTGFITEFDEVPKATNDNVYENEISIQPVGAWVLDITP